ncbi:MAG TPA: MFS transporter [Thermomicrobiales bacterium]|nr:MFS transporter [Thermomicrobiales bacterium]
MTRYWRGVAECGRDVHLLLIYALLSYLGIGVLALIFNLYLVRLGYDEAFIGAFNGIYTLAMGFTCLALGFLINRFGNWQCIVWGTAQFVVASIVLCFLTNSTLLLVFGALIGIGSAFILTTQMPFVIELTPRAHTSTIAALSSALNSASVMFGSLAGGLLPGVIGFSLGIDGGGIDAYRWTMVIGALATGMSLIPMAAMGEARRQRHHSDFQVAQAQLPGHRVRDRARRDVGALVLLGLLLALGVGAIEPFYNVLLEDMGTPTSQIGLIFAVSGLVATVLSIAGPPLANRIGLIPAQIWTRLMHVPFHLGLIVLAHPALVSLAYGTRRVSGSMAWPLESAHVGGLLPQRARAHAFGLRSASWNIGFAIAAFASGNVIAATGSYTPAYIALGGFCALSVLVYVVAYGGRLPDDADRQAQQAPTLTPPNDPTLSGHADAPEKQVAP